MKPELYILDLAIAGIGIGLYMHISDCSGKYLARAEFDEHIAAVRCADGMAIRRQGEIDRAAGSYVLPPSVNRDDARASVAAGADFRDGDRAPADVCDADALHGLRDAKLPDVPTNACENADARSIPLHAAEVADERIDEVRKGNERPDGDKH